MLVQTLLITLLAIVARCHTFFGTNLINRPIILGTVTGLIMGDLTTGIIMGGTLELAFIGAVSIGAYIPPDMISGTILGVAFAMKAGAGPEAALTLGMPIASIMLAVNTIVGTPMSLALVHVLDAKAEKGDAKGFNRWFYIMGFFPKLITLPIIPIAFFFGSDAVTGVLNSLPEFIQTGINISGGLIPALGFAMLAQMIMNKKVAPFFFLGFFAVQYLGINTTAAAIFGIIIALVLVQIEGRFNQNTANQEVGLDEF